MALGGAADRGAAVVGHQDRPLDEDRVGHEHLDPRGPVLRRRPSGRARRRSASPMPVISQGSLPMAVSTASSSAAVGGVVEVAALGVGDAAVVEQLLGLAGLRASGVVPQLHAHPVYQLASAALVASWTLSWAWPSPCSAASGTWPSADVGLLRLPRRRRHHPGLDRLRPRHALGPAAALRPRRRRRPRRHPRAPRPLHGAPGAPQRHEVRPRHVERLPLYAPRGVLRAARGARRARRASPRASSRR